MDKQYAEVSKYLSYVLHHQPEAIGLTLDREGWADIGLLIICTTKNGKHLDQHLIKSIVENSDKKRFAISEDGLRIRAVQGHFSQQVDIEYQETPPLNFYTMEPLHDFYRQLMNKG